MSSPIIIGLTGSFGSGCTHIAQTYLISQGFKYISLSQILKDIYAHEYPGVTPTRNDLQNYGNSIRSQSRDYLAQEAKKNIETENCCWVVDSIKNPHEVEYLRDAFSNFFLIGVYADYAVRWKRVERKYDGHEGIFKRDDTIDSSEDFDHGQRVRDCFSISDIIIINNTDYTKGNDDQLSMESKINEYLKLIRKESGIQPAEEEVLMAMAYANSLRSSCLKRKVGAVIVDNNGYVFSSGYNEVPISEKACKNAHGGCYRDLVKKDIHDSIDTEISADPQLNDRVKKQVLSKIKILERCRSLHAEEQAILNVARLGSSLALKGATLYTTTYPCNLCANKIAQVGISRVVYLEPYPQEEAKTVLKNQKIEQKPFEGVSFKGIFKLFGGEFL